MAYKITPDEARHIIKEHKVLLDDLYAVGNAYQQFTVDAGVAARQLINEKILASQVEACIKKDQSFHEIGGCADALVHSLFFCKAYSPLKEDCDRLLLQYEGPIRNSISSLKKAGYGLRRFFASAQKKDQAAEAFDMLQQYLTGQFARSVRSLVSDTEKVHFVSDRAIWDDFLQNKKQYQKILYDLAPGIGSDGEAIPIFAKQLSAIRTLDGLFCDLENSRQQIETEVKDSVHQITWRDVLRILQGVPVEEASRKHSGMRLKVLHDYGYNSMADIYGASVYNLASVRGVSEDTAWELKKIAEGFAKEAQRTVKLQLSADNKTKETSALICALYQYKSFLDRSQRFYALEKIVRDRKKSAASFLQDTINGIYWIFCEEKERKQISDAYSYLSWLENSDYAIELKKLSPVGGMIYSPEAAWQDFEENAAAYYTLLEQIVPDVLGNGDSLYGLPEELAREINEEAFFPDGLLCTLRRYQEWGVKFILHQGRVLLGDEMGLGKTVQAIAAMVSLRNIGATHFIVVCPASVLENWCREVAKHSKLRITRIYGSGKNLAFLAWQRTGGTAITTYETLKSLHPDDDFSYDMLVVDEAHYVKNPNAARTKQLKEFCTFTDRILFMTGTPLENHVDEMVNLIRLLQPQLAERLEPFKFMSAAPQFRDMIAPVYYRRKRENVLTELPELIEVEEWCDLSDYEQSFYHDTLMSEHVNYAEVRRVSWNIDDLKESTKAKRMVELANEAAEDGRKIIVFSFFLDTLRKTALLLGDKCIGIINGSVSPNRRQEILDAFEKASPGTVLVAQIQSGGTGLNIQSASVVIICEPQLKPSTEVQAISRAYRMGQARNVLVYRLLCSHTIDERIMEMLEEKKKQFDAFADKSVAAEESVAIDEKTLGNLIQEEINRINGEKKE